MAKTYEEKLSLLQDSLLNMEHEKKVDMLHTWQEDNYYYDDMWMDMEEFNELLAGKEPTEIINAIDKEKFDTGDDYFKSTIYGYVSGEFNDIVVDFDDNVKDIAEWFFIWDEDTANDLIVADNNNISYEDLEEEDLEEDLEEEEEEEE